MKFTQSLTLVLILILTYSAGTYFGDFDIPQHITNFIQEQKPESKDQVEKTETISPRPEIGISFVNKVLEIALEKFWHPDDITSQNITYGAITGVIAGLGDPYSEFYNPQKADDFLITVDGELSGIGAEIGYDSEKNIVIIAPLPDSPAEKAGLQSKDQILAVDDQSIIDFTVQETVELIRGPRGEDVRLLVLRPQSITPEEITITRDQIHLDSLVTTYHEDGIFEIQISQFDEDTPRELTQNIEQVLASEKKITGILLDLRNNVGGYFEGAISVAGEFLEPGTTVVIEKEGKQENRRVARGLGRLKDIPIVVLVNNGTASAAEILAGTLKQLGEAILVGTQTYGKGTVQEIVEFPDGSILKVTVAEWLLPDSTPVNEIGITPNMVVELTKEDYINEFDRQKDEAEKKLQELITANNQ